MGLSWHQSAGLGPLRLNFSSSGVGASVGVRGARLSVGPRGTYVHLGAGGFRYSQRIDGPRIPLGPEQRFPTSAKPAPYNPIASAIECIDTSRIEDSTADGLLQEIRSKQNTQEYGVMCGILAIVLICLGVICLASPDARLFGYFLTPLGLGLLCYLPQALWRDEVSRKVRIHYVLDPLVENIQESLERLLGALQRTEAVWSIKSDIRHGDWKRHAGAY